MNAQALNTIKTLLTMDNIDSSTIQYMIQLLTTELHEKMIEEEEDTALDNMHTFLAEINDRYDLITIDGNLNQL